MTVIALDKQSIAWDSQITVGDEKVAFAADKVWVVGHVIYAFAGDYGVLHDVIKWQQKRRKPERPPGGQWELLVVTKKGATLYSDDCPFKTPVTAPFAMGSGAPFARGAMMAGATAYQAAKIAAQCDIFSGGEIGSLKLEDGFKGRT